MLKLLRKKNKFRKKIKNDENVDQSIIEIVKAN
jgi:hypothetical protein